MAQKGAVAPTAAKQPLFGLVAMGGIGPLLLPNGHADNTLKEAYVHPGVYSGAVLLFSWDELEHVEGKLDSSRIDAALNNVRHYNEKYPDTPLRAKIRIFSGSNTPAWALAKGGGPIEIEHKGAMVTTGRFWTKEYQMAFRGLQELLAAKYDEEPLLAEIAVSSCATVTAEPFVQPLTKENLAKLHPAGFSDAGFKGCLLGALDDYARWKYTAIDYTMNPFRDTDGGKDVTDSAFLKEVMTKFRKSYGRRAVVANHGLQSPLLDRQKEIYTFLREVGPPIEFQTISPVLDWDAAFELGMNTHATEIEVWNTKDAGGPANVTFDQLKRWKVRMDEARPR